MTSSSSANPNSRSSFSRWLSLALLTACMFSLVGCKATGSLRIQPYNRPLSASDLFADGSSARKLVPGTVPQTDQQLSDAALTGKNESGDFVTTIPVPISTELVKRGQERFEIYCLVCHGADGHGDGKAVAVYQFNKPPDLLDDAAKALADGEIFDVIANGKNTMLSYGYRVKALDRWAVVVYLRAMQLKGGHLTQDLTPTELQQLGGK